MGKGIPMSKCLGCYQAREGAKKAIVLFSSGHVGEAFTEAGEAAVIVGDILLVKPIMTAKKKLTEILRG
jgi:hypothetical protein